MRELYYLRRRFFGRRSKYLSVAVCGKCWKEFEAVLLKGQLADHRKTPRISLRRYESIFYLSSPGRPWWALTQRTVLLWEVLKSRRRELPTPPALPTRCPNNSGLSELLWSVYDVGPTKLPIAILRFFSGSLNKKKDKKKKPFLDTSIVLSQLSLKT